MRSTGFAAAVGGVVALVGFAGAANASATIDLIWFDTGTNEISGVVTSSAITLQVIVTAGPGGVQAAVVSVDYSAALGTLSVLGFASTPDFPLPIDLVETIDTGSRIENFNSGSLPPFVGNGLSEGQSHQLGTVTFHNSALLNGTFAIRSDANSAGDVVFDIDGAIITDTTTFNSAFLVNVDVHEPDFDGDGVGDAFDNCSEAPNPGQDDTDADDCGNLCDADYDQAGYVSFSDFGAFSLAFQTNDEQKCHVEPISGCTVGWGDFGFFGANFQKIPGPSGTTAGTIACPL